MWPIRVLAAVSFLLGCDGPASEVPAPPADAVAAPASDAAPPTAPPPHQPPAALGGEACESAGTMPRLLGGLRAAQPVDYVELRKIMPGDAGLVSEVIEQNGQACAGTTDVTACENALAAALPEQGFGFGCRPLQCHEVLVYSRGDEVGVVSTLDQLTAFLGPVDELSEALLLLRAHRYQTGGCKDVLDGQVQTEAEGFTARVAKRIADCPVQYADLELFVARTGEVAVRSEKKRPLGKEKMCI